MVLYVDPPLNNILDPTFAHRVIYMDCLDLEMSNQNRKKVNYLLKLDMDNFEISKPPGLASFIDTFFRRKLVGRL